MTAPKAPPVVPKRPPSRHAQAANAQNNEWIKA